MKILVIVPAYNEAEIIAETVEAIRVKAPETDILVINDGSRDATLRILRNCGVRYLDHSMNLGIGAAMQSGYMYAREHGYDYAVQIDGDGQHDPAYIMPLIRWMEENHVDVGIGSRFLEKEGFQTSRSRRTGIRLLSSLIRLVCGITVQDVTSGFRAVNRKFIDLFASEYSDDYPEPDSIPAIVSHGGKIGEYPVIMNERTTGASSISAWKSVYYMIKVSFSILMYRIMHDT